MNLRDNCTQADLRAHQILDRVKAGLPVCDEEVTTALWMLGEPVDGEMVA